MVPMMVRHKAYRLVTGTRRTCVAGVQTDKAHCPSRSIGLVLQNSSRHENQQGASPSRPGHVL
ncbi:hypothetical protein ABBQ38_15562 [Trebouxia sp. C0009 RCD-2024]